MGQGRCCWSGKGQVCAITTRPLPPAASHPLFRPLLSNFASTTPFQSIPTSPTYALAYLLQQVANAPTTCERRLWTSCRSSSSMCCQSTFYGFFLAASAVGTLGPPGGKLGCPRQTYDPTCTCLHLPPAQPDTSFQLRTHCFSVPHLALLQSAPPFKSLHWLPLTSANLPFLDTSGWIRSP